MFTRWHRTEDYPELSRFENSNWSRLQWNCCIRKPWELCIQKTYKRLGLSRFSLHSVLFPSNGALLLTVKVYDGAKEMDLRISWNFHRERSVCPPMFMLTVIYAHFPSFSDIFRKIIRKLMFLGVAFRVTSWAECTNFHEEL